MFTDLKPFSHRPVLLQELLFLFSQKNPPKNILDCTFGRGGHSLAFLKSFPSAFITALDRDETAIEFGLTLKESKKRKITLLNQNFYEYPFTFENKEYFDFVLMDLGASSPQLDDGERGFSFYKKGPLDMRMDQKQILTAQNIINQYSKQELISLFKTYGEIRSPHRVVSDIVTRRRKKPFETTTELSQLIRKHYSFNRNKHPATTWFLALRIAVNQELTGLKRCFKAYLELLRPKAYWAVISFHSLEDRMVKQTFRQFVKEGMGELYNKKVIRAQKEERQKNPRSRSAKLRVFQKL
ncbi:MAG: 16S rRNA (cytosine(1402)-N(4))-methyltransferase RsmH [Oligoflexia bacterium]|nr:16S rRNA (cytosine(1402)-N(4))-methyltransferase RsmH [Oligoflexia bacterium]